MNDAVRKSNLVDKRKNVSVNRYSNLKPIYTYLHFKYDKQEIQGHSGVCVCTRFGCLCSNVPWVH